MALRFQSDSCTARKIQEASQYGHASFECARAPEDAPEARGGYECITSSNGQYPMTIKGCQECTSSCGVGKKKNGNGNGNKPDTSSSSSRGLSTGAKVSISVVVAIIGLIFIALLVNHFRVKYSYI